MIASTVICIARGKRLKLAAKRLNEAVPKACLIKNIKQTMKNPNVKSIPILFGGVPFMTLPQQKNNRVNVESNRNMVVMPIDAACGYF